MYLIPKFHLTVGTAVAVQDWVLSSAPGIHRGSRSAHTQAPSCMTGTDETLPFLHGFCSLTGKGFARRALEYRPLTIHLLVTDKALYTQTEGRPQPHKPAT